MIPTIAAPMLDFPGAAVTALQVLATASSYQNEVNPASRAPYSKFFFQSQENKSNQISSTVPSKMGMTVIYGLPFLASVYVQTMHDAPPTLAGILLVLHFFKRLMEVHFVHSYSGGMGRDIAIGIGIYYSLAAVLISSVATDMVSPTSQTWGILLFALGSLGNLYHHVLLARLRSNNNKSPSSTATASTSSYVPPTGGLFDYAAAPHYMFELLAWLGIAVASQHGNAFLVFTSMTSYLAGRSVAQNEFNFQTFGPKEWPQQDRYNMVPFVF